MSLIKDLRKPRIAGIAIFDLLLAIIATAWLFDQYGASPLLGAAAAVPIGIIVHYIFSIDTTLNHALGLSNKPAV